MMELSELKMLEVNSNSKYMDNCDDEDFYKVTDVERYCLGKQFVKKIIDEHWGATKDHIPIDGNYLYLIKTLKLSQE